MDWLLMLARDRQIPAWRAISADLAIRFKQTASREGLRGGVLGHGEIAFGAALVMFQMN